MIVVKFWVKSVAFIQNERVNGKLKFGLIAELVPKSIPWPALVRKRTDFALEKAAGVDPFGVINILPNEVELNTIRITRNRFIRNYLVYFKSKAKSTGEELLDVTSVTLSPTATVFAAVADEVAWVPETDIADRPVTLVPFILMATVTVPEASFVVRSLMVYANFAYSSIV